MQLCIYISRGCSQKLYWCNFARALHAIVHLAINIKFAVTLAGIVSLHFTRLFTEIVHVLMQLCTYISRSCSPLTNEVAIKFAVTLAGIVSIHFTCLFAEIILVQLCTYISCSCSLLTK